MELENDRISKLIFPNGIPENLKNDNELFTYLDKLGTYKIEKLKKEQSRLSEENRAIVEQTQDLAITNYKTFIKTSECSKQISDKFKETEDGLDKLIGILPNVTKKCQDFISTSSEINTSRRLNSLTLKRNAQLLEILELPQLVDTCIRDGKYEEALELAAYVQRLGVKHGNVPIVNSIIVAIEASWHTMLKQLLSQLKTDLQLPKCLQVVGYIRRMQAFSTAELKIVFLRTRDDWFNQTLSNIPNTDSHQHLMKTIELTRVNLFNIVTQYKATFPDEDTSNSKDQSGSMLFSWLHRKIEHFLQTLEVDLKYGVNSIDSILDQCMYFGLSFSRIGADFRGLMVPIFVKVIFNQFQNGIYKSSKQFETDIETYTLINKVIIDSSRENLENTGTTPPDSLLDFHPLAVYCNGIVACLNELRHCAPLALAESVTHSVQSSLESIALFILNFYRQEQQAFATNERTNFIKFCSCFAYDLIPYLQRCLHVVFEPVVVTGYLGINEMTLQKAGITFLKPKQIMEPIQHLLPDKVETIMQNSEKKILEEVKRISIGTRKPEEKVQRCYEKEIIQIFGRFEENFKMEPAYQKEWFSTVMGAKWNHSAFTEKFYDK